MRNFVLDTNLVLAFQKTNQNLIEKVVSENDLNDSDAVLMISAITRGELLSIALQNNWGDAKLQRLAQILESLITLDIGGDDEVLLNAYAEIDAFCKKRHPTKKLVGSAKPMGKNDLWIAATAMATNATLLTTDGKFQHIADVMIRMEVYNPRNF